MLARTSYAQLPLLSVSFAPEMAQRLQTKFSIGSEHFTFFGSFYLMNSGLYEVSPRYTSPYINRTKNLARYIFESRVSNSSIV